jgi:hypothetical protein
MPGVNSSNFRTDERSRAPCRSGEQDRHAFLLELLQIAVRPSGTTKDDLNY